jgi:sortase (surface protein transpeptidase)
LGLFKNNIKTILRRPHQWPPSFREPAKKWRARSFTIALPLHNQLVITFPKFKTSPARDSKRFKQFILEIRDSPIREVALALKHRPAVKKKRQNNILPFALPAPAAFASLLIVGGLAGVIFFATHLHKQVSFDIKPSQKVQAISAPTSAKSMPASAPTRLSIPKLGVETNLQQVGLQANGQMETPWDITVAAWYKYSPTPGQLGPSVIVGHLDGANYANMAGVFYRLRELVPGDKFSVSRADGTVANFKVLSLAQVPQNNFPTQQIYGNINYAGIRLITCGGTFDSSSNHYTQNTVVFGALE